MFCEQCGTKNDDSAKFCSSCGTGIAEAVTTSAQSQATPNVAPNIATENIAASLAIEEKSKGKDQSFFQENWTWFAFLGVIIAGMAWFSTSPKSESVKIETASPDRHEMGRILSECWYYWGYAQIVMIKSNKASPQQLDNVREKVELSQDLAFRLIGKEMALFHHGNTSNLYIVQRKMGVDINPDISREAKKCNEFLDTSKTANAIKQMLSSGNR